jgi:hypothetical protein
MSDQKKTPVSLRLSLMGWARPGMEWCVSCAKTVVLKMMPKPAVRTHTERERERETRQSSPMRTARVHLLTGRVESDNADADEGGLVLPSTQSSAHEFASLGVVARRYRLGVLAGRVWAHCR